MAIHGLPDTDDINGEAAINTPGLIDGHRRMENHRWSATTGSPQISSKASSYTHGCPLDCMRELHVMRGNACLTASGW